MARFRPLAGSTFVTLQAQLPHYGELGHTRAFWAQQLLDELDYFTQLGERVVLVDEHSGHEISEYIPAYDGAWSIGGGTGSAQSAADLRRRPAQDYRRRLLAA